MAKFQIDLLDVGAIEYGDSVLIQAGGLTALIDGGKAASAAESRSTVLGEEVRHASLQKQISSLLGGNTEVDLLVVTHCHSDHVGCLPKIFADGSVSCKWALVADPQLGFGITSDEDLLPDYRDMSARQKLRLALRDEPTMATDAAEVREFVEDAAREYSAYVDFVKALRTRIGNKCVEYRGLTEEQSEGITALLAAMAPMNLKIYGPSLTQLVRCAGFLEGRADEEDAIEQALRTSSGDIAAAYQALRPAPLADGDEAEGGNGNAVNNQSLVLSVSDGANRVLLTGDMQFVRPQLDDDELKEEMKALIAAVEADAPFDFVKLSHHGATNGQNLAFLRKLQAGLFGISTGSRSRKHPTEPTLKALADLETSDGIEWARVDINGRCRYSVRNGKGRLSVSRNDLNDKTLPAERSGDVGEAQGGMEAQPAAPRPAPASPPPMQPSAVSTMQADGGVEVVVRIPPGGAKVSLTIEVQPAPLG